ncbi:hypothetical protein SDRG_15229 [Saprolegnia diclina VS20]|nr:hypothetical protein SDRG_15229 [Saprolegnia diclina VS20]EQC26896.1 hypothetical protein SDRG_15229 [Saprolegnia diclina VS20]|eukprot:XP_008619617.1 hypothetical protein SDRG_15229 [Saprolegnia diclina VS20]
MRNTHVSLFSDAVDDVLRLHRVQEAATENDAPVDLATVFPPTLMRRFELQLVPGVKTKPVPIREVKASKVGSFVRIKGTVARVSNVKPLVIVATYTCEVCSFEVYQEIKSRDFNPLVRQHDQRAPPLCQKVTLQELPDQVPMVHIPRPFTVYLRGELTRSCEFQNDLSSEK